MRPLIPPLLFPQSQNISSTQKNRVWAHTLISHRKPALRSKSLQYFLCSSPIVSVPHISTTPGNGGYHICIDKKPALCHGLCLPQAHKINGENNVFKCLLRAFTTSGCHSVRATSSACSTFKQYRNGRTHFAQNFITWPYIDCAISGKQTCTDIVFDCNFLKITIIFSSCKVINPASNPKPSFSQIIRGLGSR